MKSDDNMQGFKTIFLKTSSDGAITHSIFAKEHSVRVTEANRPPGRTLFLLNVPPFVDEDGIRYIFRDVGKIVSVELTDKPSASGTAPVEGSYFNPPPCRGFKVVYVVFGKPSELKKALLIGETRPLFGEGSPSTVGIDRYVKDYNSSIPEVERLSSEIEIAMRKHDEDAKRNLEKAKELTEADDEGWVTVTKRGKRPGFERKERVENKIVAEEKSRRQKKELKNFYTFQIRESKMKHVIELRQKFEEDKKKIAILKESRRFKPF